MESKSHLRDAISPSPIRPPAKEDTKEPVNEKI